MIARVAITATMLGAALAPAAAFAQNPCANAALGGVGPDCRALEQVTPADKNGRTVQETEPVTVAAVGGRVSFRSRGAFAGNDSAPYVSSFLGRRDDADWSVRGIDPPMTLVGIAVTPATLAVSADGTKAVVLTRTALTPGANERGTSLYLRDLDAPSSYRLIANSAQGLNDGTTLVEGNPDFSVLAIQSTVPLGDDVGTLDGQVRSYRWTAAGLTPVDRVNTFLPADPDDPFGFERWSSAPSFDETRRTVSTDGERLTYERYTGVRADDLQPEVRQLVSGTSRLVSHPNGAPDTPADGTSPIAAPDGRTVTFVSADALTAASTGAGQSLYRWTAASDTSVDLLAGVDGLEWELRGLRIDTVSVDGRYVWFTSSSAVRAGGDPNPALYLLDTANDALADVTSLPADEQSVRRYSPNGEVLALTRSGGDFSQAQLSTARAGSGGALECVTCGGFPAGGVTIDRAAPPSRTTPVLDDGRVFFDTVAQLDSRDVDAAADVYQSTPDADSATRTTTLLSSGQDALPSLFGGVSDDGRDVYVVTQNQLVPADVDDRTDVFSARADGGIAAQQIRPVAVEPCRGDACKPPATPVPATPSPVNEGSNEPAPPAPASPPAFDVSTPSASARRAAVRTGRLSLRVRVGAAGTISAGLRGKVRGSTRTLASRTTRVSGARTVTLRLQLSRAARGKLRRTGRLSARLTVAYSERTNRVRKTIILKGGRR